MALPDAVLLARFGERARFIAASVRGISDEPVQVSTLADIHRRNADVHATPLCLHLCALPAGKACSLW